MLGAGCAGTAVDVEDGTAAMRPIKQGQRQGEWVVVDSGVSAGENVVTTGQKFVAPGAPVRIANPAAAGTAGATAATAAEGVSKS